MRGFDFGLFVQVTDEKDQSLLVSEIFYPGTCRHALSIILQILIPLDAWSLILLESNFAEVLESHHLDAAQDVRVTKSVLHIRYIADMYERMHCRCGICLRAAKVGHWMVDAPASAS